MGEKNDRNARGLRVRESKQAVTRSVKAGGAIHDPLTLLSLPSRTAVASMLLHAPRHAQCFTIWTERSATIDWGNPVHVPTRMIPTPMHKRCARCGAEFEDDDDASV